jgi:hemolysin III
MTEVATTPAPRPALRGSLHRAAVPVAVALTALLAIRTAGGGDRAAVLVYGASVTAMLAVSGTYHHRRLSHRERRLLRRVDHTMILVATAGTYTAVIVLALDGTTRVVLLVVAWALVVAGAAVRMVWLDAPSGLVAAVYVVAGWQIVLDLPAYVRALDVGELALLGAGGACYSLGALVYARRRPDPRPAVFGYHEVFHALVVAGALCHWLAVLALVG